MKLRGGVLVLVTIQVLGNAPAEAEEVFSCHYYRLGNTGIQGNYNYALWIAPDVHPYIGGLDPIFGEGGRQVHLEREPLVDESCSRGDTRSLGTVGVLAPRCGERSVLLPARSGWRQIEGPGHTDPLRHDMPNKESDRIDQIEKGSNRNRTPDGNPQGGAA